MLHYTPTYGVPVHANSEYISRPSPYCLGASRALKFFLATMRVEASSGWLAASHSNGACQGTGSAAPSAVLTRTGAIPRAATNLTSSPEVFTI